MGTDATDSINLIGFLFAAAMGILLIRLPRRLALLPIILTVCYMTIGQQVVIAGLHFSIIRIMILVGWVRLIFRGELKGVRFNEIDRVLIAWQVSRVMIYTLQYGTTNAFMTINGYAYDAVGTFFLLRFLVRDLEEIPRIIKMISISVVPLAVLMSIEKTTTQNLFYIFGGVSPSTWIDEGGRLRCQGPFRHPILAGTFGATLIPLFLGLWFQGHQFKKYSVAGILAATIIVLAAHSSGPFMVWVFAFVGMALWRFREHLRLVRWGGAFALAALHMIMKDPVWALFGRLSELTGGTGYHRTMLITAAVSNFNEWWLVGTHDTGHWMPYTLRLDSSMADMTNQFIYEGVVGGLLTMLLFIIMISLGFRAVGRLVKLMEGSSPFEFRIMVWSVGVGLFAHAVSFMSVSYFDQNVVMFYLFLAFTALCSERFAVEQGKNINLKKDFDKESVEAISK
jgi:hypothetical protein